MDSKPSFLRSALRVLAVVLALFLLGNFVWIATVQQRKSSGRGSKSTVVKDDLRLLASPPPATALPSPTATGRVRASGSKSLAPSVSEQILAPVVEGARNAANPLQPAPTPTTTPLPARTSP